MRCDFQVGGPDRESPLLLSAMLLKQGSPEIHHCVSPKDRIQTRQQDSLFALRVVFLELAPGN